MEITKSQAELILQILPTVTLGINNVPWKNFVEESKNGENKVVELQKFEDALNVFINDQNNADPSTSSVEGEVITPIV